MTGRIYAPGVRTKRTQLTTFRLSHAERKVLARVAAAMGVSKTDVVREGIALVAGREERDV